MPFSLSMPKSLSKLPKISLLGRKNTEELAKLPNYNEVTDLPQYHEVVRRKTDTFEPGESSEPAPSIKRSATDTLLEQGPKHGNKDYQRWQKKNAAEWRKDVAKGRTTQDFEVWLERKMKAQEKARLLREQFDRETAEIYRGERRAYSQEVRHLIPNPYGYGTAYVPIMG